MTSSWALSASGTTPYVLGALRLARQRGAITVGVTSNPRSPLARQSRIAIAPDTGPEAIAGSTRLKAGTAQKMVLNLLSTAAMVRLGRVYENWMVYVALTNQKLRRRGARILEEAAGVSASQCGTRVASGGTRFAGRAGDAQDGATALDARRSLARVWRPRAAALIDAAKKPTQRFERSRKIGMDRFKIEGGRRLEGTVQISGAKNAALPAMAAALLTSEPVQLQNIPHVRDIITMAKLLAHMRCRVESPDLPPSEFTIQAETISHAEAPYELVKTMRASVLTLGPLRGAVRLCPRFPSRRMRDRRPADRPAHSGARKTGRGNRRSSTATSRRGRRRLRGATFRFPKITVTGTENILTAAVLAEGETVLENAALEPEVTDLVATAHQNGGENRRCGHIHASHTQGVERLHGATHAIIPDRIETGTFLVAGAITGGELLLTGCEPGHLTAVIEKLRECGVEIHCEGSGTLRVRAAKKLVAADITTEEYPGFATDMQAQFMALATQAQGVSHVRETIFENRYMHASEMVRMGANIAIDGNLAVVTGPTPLSGAPVTASDLRASAALVLAGLVANNTTWIDRVYHIDRGYERIEEKLRSIGARIERITACRRGHHKRARQNARLPLLEFAGVSNASDRTPSRGNRRILIRLSPRLRSSCCLSRWSRKNGLAAQADFVAFDGQHFHQDLIAFLQFVAHGANALLPRFR